jgi:hypothetical protein
MEDMPIFTIILWHVIISYLKVCSRIVSFNFSYQKAKCSFFLLPVVVYIFNFFLYIVCFFHIRYIFLMRCCYGRFPLIFKKGASILLFSIVDISFSQAIRTTSHIWVCGRGVKEWIHYDSISSRIDYLLNQQLVCYSIFVLSAYMR